MLMHLPLVQNLNLNLNLKVRFSPNPKIQTKRRPAFATLPST